MLPASTAGTIHHDAYGADPHSHCRHRRPGRRLREHDDPPKGALTGAALGSGIGMVAGGSFGQVVGAGLIGGAVGYLGGSAIDSK
jgi:hypothetical protein